MASKKTCKRLSGNKRTLNIAKLIRANAYIKRGNKKVYLKVSSESEKEIISRIVIAIEDNMPLIAQMAHDNGRTTIRAGVRNGESYDDVVAFFGKRSSHVIDGTNRV